MSVRHLNKTTLHLIKLESSNSLTGECFHDLQKNDNAYNKAFFLFSCTKKFKLKSCTGVDWAVWSSHSDARKMKSVFLQDFACWGRHGSASFAHYKLWHAALRAVCCWRARGCPMQQAAKKRDVWLAQAWNRRLTDRFKMKTQKYRLHVTVTSQNLFFSLS